MMMAVVRRFASYDGTELAYEITGQGAPLVCIPGGPGQSVEYLGDLGGLSTRRTLVLLHNRGTGSSSVPIDPVSYRVDRLVYDVEALRVELGLERLDLFGHSASGGICMLYAAAHPSRLRRLVLANPSLRAVGLASDLELDVVLSERSGEPWYAAAVLAHRLAGEAPSRAEAEAYWPTVAPLSYGRWDDAARAHADAAPGQFVAPATEGFYAGFDPDVATVQSQLAALSAPVLVIAGQHDTWPTRNSARHLAALFGCAEVVELERVGHFPWVDDAERFVGVVDGFLSDAAMDV